LDKTPVLTTQCGECVVDLSLDMYFEWCHEIYFTCQRQTPVCYLKVTFSQQRKYMIKKTNK
jgi:hypothetical protein